ncbi:uncharacterized protein ACN427_009961 isoform 2-T2 [Glossina fuscipes fuscipes]
MSVEMKVTVTAMDREAVDKIVSFNNQLKVPGRKRSSSIVDDEIIQKNLRELMDKKNREERKANGRLVAVILASLVIFLAIYHAWIRKSGLLAGILVPAVIMISFGGWVVVLTKRDKARRALFEKYLEEVAMKNKRELEAKAKLKQFKKTGDKRRLSKDTISLHYENELNKEKSNNNTLLQPLEFANIVVTSATRHEHRKHRKHREQLLLGQNAAKASHYATKDLRFKRPSLRQKLFGSKGVYQMQQQQKQQQQQSRKISFTISKTKNQQNDPKTLTQLKRKRLQRHNALIVPTMVRTSSAP